MASKTRVVRTPDQRLADLEAKAQQIREALEAKKAKANAKAAPARISAMDELYSLLGVDSINRDPSEAKRSAAVVAKVRELVDGGAATPQAAVVEKADKPVKAVKPKGDVKS